MKHPSRQAEGRAFSRILADVGRSGARDEESLARLLNPAAAAAFPFVESDSPDGAGWDDVLDGFVEQDEEPGEGEGLSSSDRPEVIALELGLDRLSSEEELNRARRRFMWRNHPDRRNQAQRALADRRVAVANMLIDRARAALAARRKRP
jgi:hypothetical protein